MNEENTQQEAVEETESEQAAEEEATEEAAAGVPTEAQPGDEIPDRNHV